MIDWANWAYDNRIDKMPIDEWLREYEEQDCTTYGEQGILETTNHIVQMLIEYMLYDAAQHYAEIFLDASTMSVSLSGKIDNDYTVEIDMIAYKQLNNPTAGINYIPVHIKSNVHILKGTLFDSDNKLSELGIKFFTWRFIKNLRFV